MKRSLVGNQSCQEHLLARRARLSQQLTQIDAKLSELSSLAIKMVKGGQSTGDKIRDAIIKVRGYSCPSIERLASALSRLEGKPDGEMLNDKELLELCEKPVDLTGVVFDDDEMKVFAEILGIDEAEVSAEKIKEKLAQLGQSTK